MDSDHLTGPATRNAPIRYAGAGVPGLTNNDRLGGFNPNQEAPRSQPRGGNAVPPPAARAAPAPGGPPRNVEDSAPPPPPLVAVRDLDLGLLHPRPAASWHLAWSDSVRSAAYDVPGTIRRLSLKKLHDLGKAADAEVQEGQTYRLALRDEHGLVGTFRIRILTGAEQAQLDASVHAAEADWVAHHDGAVWALLVADLERHGAWSAALQAVSDTVARHPELKGAMTDLQTQVETDLAAVRKEAAESP